MKPHRIAAALLLVLLVLAGAVPAVAHHGVALCSPPTACRWAAWHDVHGSGDDPTGARLSADGSALYAADLGGVFAVGTADGSLQWSRALPSLVTFLAGQIALSPDGALLHVAGFDRHAPSKILRVETVRASDGSHVWATAVGDDHNEVLDLVVGPDGAVFVGARALVPGLPSVLRVVALDGATGALRWQETTPVANRFQAAVSPDGLTLFTSVTTPQGTLSRAVGTSDGRAIWSVTHPASLGVFLHTDLVVAPDGSRLYHVGERVDPPRRDLVTSTLHAVSALQLHAFSPADGTTLWSAAKPAPSPVEGGKTLLPRMALAHDHVYAGATQQDTGGWGLGLFAADAASGATLWTLDERDVPTSLHIRHLAASSDGSRIFASATDGCCDLHVLGFDAHAGARDWRASFESFPVLSREEPPRAIALAPDDATLYALASSRHLGGSPDHLVVAFDTTPLLSG